MNMIENKMLSRTTAPAGLSAAAVSESLTGNGIGIKSGKG